MQILEKQRQTAQRDYIEDLRQENADVQPYSLNNLKGKHTYLVNAALEADGYSAKCAALTKVRTHSAFGHYSYEPTIVVGAHTIKKEHRLELFFVSYVLERVQEKRAVYGYIVGLDGKSHRVKLENGSKTLIPFLEPLGEWVAEETPDPPSLILNKNCPACQFREMCREKAVQEDNLSLLDGISTQKAINKYEKKGLFTVKQLSYTFKPRRRRKRVKNPPPVINKPELQALAIREQKIYLQELPELTRQPVELFLDIEGVPDRQFYYLIGLLVSEKGTTTYHPFWADTPEDEAQIWKQFLEEVNQYPDVPIYHYGSFEPRSLTKLGNRYDTEVEDLINRLVNVNKHIYGKVYFPVYSNRLKEIGAFVGATWTAPSVSGLQSLTWWHYWEETCNAKYKDLLLIYNEEDCLALRLLTNELSRIKHSESTLSEFEFADQYKERVSGVSQQVNDQFRAILRFAHFGYEKKKISFRQEDKAKGKRSTSERQRQKIKKSLPKHVEIRKRAKRIVQISPDERCPRWYHPKNLG
jgi:predicted RecB family nuclease